MADKNFACAVVGHIVAPVPSFMERRSIEPQLCGPTDRSMIDMPNTRVCRVRRRRVRYVESKSEVPRVHGIRSSRGSGGSSSASSIAPTVTSETATGTGLTRSGATGMARGRGGESDHAPAAQVIAWVGEVGSCTRCPKKRPQGKQVACKRRCGHCPIFDGPCKIWMTSSNV